MENTKYGYTTYGQDVQNYIYLPDDKITVQQSNNTCPACYTTYCDDASIEQETTVIIKDKHNINIKIEQSAANPFLSEMEKNISANADNIASLQSDFTEHVQANIQDFTDVRTELTNVKSQLTNVNINVQTNEKNITELSDYVKDFENSISETVDEEVTKSLQNKDLMTGAEVKDYVDSAIEQVDVTEQLSSYATITYVDEKLSEIDVTEQLADYIDASKFEDSEFATAQMFAVLNKDLLYKADKSEFMMYSTLDYVDKQDRIIYNYIDNKSSKLLQISDYEKNTEDTNFALAQIIAEINQQVIDISTRLSQVNTGGSGDTSTDSSTDTPETPIQPDIMGAFRASGSEPGSVIYLDDNPIAVLVVDDNITGDNTVRAMALDLMSAATPATGTRQAEQLYCPTGQLNAQGYTQLFTGPEEAYTAGTPFIDGHSDFYELIAFCDNSDFTWRNHTDLTECNISDNYMDRTHIPAAEAVFLYNVAGLSGYWYMPSMHELSIVYQNLSAIQSGFATANSDIVLDDCGEWQTTWTSKYIEGDQSFGGNQVKLCIADGTVTTTYYGCAPDPGIARAFIKFRWTSKDNLSLELDQDYKIN